MIYVNLQKSPDIYMDIFCRISAASPAIPRRRSAGALVVVPRQLSPMVLTDPRR